MVSRQTLIETYRLPTPRSVIPRERLITFFNEAIQRAFPDWDPRRRDWMVRVNEQLAETAWTVSTINVEQWRRGFLALAIGTDLDDFGAISTPPVPRRPGETDDIYRERLRDIPILASIGTHDRNVYNVANAGIEGIVDVQATIQPEGSKTVVAWALKADRVDLTPEEMFQIQLFCNRGDEIVQGFDLVMRAVTKSTQALTVTVGYDPRLIDNVTLNERVRMALVEWSDSLMIGQSVATSNITTPVQVLQGVQYVTTTPAQVNLMATPGTIYIMEEPDITLVQVTS